jgi:hypothetical protein
VKAKPSRSSLSRMAWSLALVERAQVEVVVLVPLGLKAGADLELALLAVELGLAVLQVRGGGGRRGLGPGGQGQQEQGADERAGEVLRQRGLRYWSGDGKRGVGTVSRPGG